MEWESSSRPAYALEHENICTIYDVGETEQGQLFIAMAFYEGETLKERISTGLITPEASLNYVSQMAVGLERAHARGIVHRDIKPANLFITVGDVLKILDLGVAKGSTQSAVTDSGKTLGTIAYMSPEQARGETVDNRTDIWSVGVVWYEMITGERPFHAEYDQAVVYNILNSDPHPLEENLENVPPEIERMILRCLQKSSSERYQSAADLFADVYRHRKSGQARSGPEDSRVAETSPGANAPGEGAGSQIEKTDFRIVGESMSRSAERAFEQILVASSSGNPGRPPYLRNRSGPTFSSISFRILRYSSVQLSGSEKPCRSIG